MTSFLRNPIFWLLPLAPITLYLQYEDGHFSFACAALALIPMVAQLTESTEQISFHASEAVGGLLNAWSGNAPDWPATSDKL